MSLEIEPNTKYCSQYSTIWWKLWKKAVITGCTLYEGLGFETLKAEREHVNFFVKNRPAPQVSSDVQKYMEFGKNNEVHAISTLVGTILPALKPSCYNFYKVGPRFFVRMHICQHSYDFCKTDNFLHLCEEWPDILSKSIVEDKADPQNVFTAVHFFSPAVQIFMIENGYTETANFIEIMRNWFNACNDH